MDTIRTVELFAGVGGFRLGLESASDSDMGKPMGTVYARAVCF